MDSPYPVFVPRTDADGNDIAGIRLPEIAVPVATYTGWGLRAAAFAGDDLCDMAGQKIDFRQTKADRLAAGDPRLVDRGTVSDPQKVRQGGDARSDPSVSAASAA